MNRTIKVFVGETAHLVGILRFEMQGARQSAGFEYHSTWLEADDAFALEPKLPLVAGRQFHKKVHDGSVFHASIADTEPDGWGRHHSNPP
jgi:serine/threonine-protein kinase HipA